MLEKWYEEYLDIHGKEYNDDEGSFIIYKGFKITKKFDDSGFVIMDVRKSDMYTRPRDRDLVMMLDHGFIKGCDLIMYERDCKRFRSYRGHVERTHSARDKFKKSKHPKLTKKKYNSKLASLNTSLRDYVDRMFFYQARKRQVERKHNLQTDEQIYSTN